MKYFKKRNAVTISLYLLLSVVVLLTGVSTAKAYQQKAADTVSSSGVAFTTIPTAADSLAARKKHLDSVKKAKSAVLKTAKLSKEKPKSLWEIFIAGLL